MAVAAALVSYMQSGHHQDMLDTGCFIKAEFEQCEPPVLRSRYLLASPRDLDRYVAEHAEAMRSDFQVHFPNGIIVCERSTWRVLVTSPTTVVM
ncbi:hypothetical protein H257_11279 [Aphanomyces astaci]|uniref:Uncharacterized protein n=1 Tax=Aphanomyces astaci TaxID=112090 RepID=W4G4U2_APHAT|nr:hypothetical protein H257_11279 [Aphanomyces astaci]ETV73963.1 hypothetical protein H257_11279 [Aphanomyces astaci]|eukprot:XP_009836476.1 hypothetical protein H257_11279 [Aphanomyces astaci]